VRQICEAEKRLFALVPQSLESEVAMERGASIRRLLIARKPGYFPHKVKRESAAERQASDLAIMLSMGGRAPLLGGKMGNGWSEVGIRKKNKKGGPKNQAAFFV